MSSNTRYTLLTLVKGLAALEALEPVDGGLTLTELARRLKESQTVVFRVLKTFEEHGYVRHDSVSRRYTLGLRIWELGTRVVGRTGLVEAARPVLKWLTTVTGQTSGLVVLRGTDVLYLDIRDGQEALRFYVEPGARAPAHGTASGKVMLAWHPERVPHVVKAGLRRLTQRRSWGRPTSGASFKRSAAPASPSTVASASLTSRRWRPPPSTRPASGSPRGRSRRP